MGVMTRVAVGLAILVGYVSMIGGECDGDQIPVEPTTVRLNVRLVNGDDTAIHLFAEGETFPCCQVAVGGDRTWSNPGVRSGQSVGFRAGRNGEIVGSVTCMVDDAYETLDTVTVRWTGAGLACGSSW